MELPKTLRTYCPKCKTHTVHTVSIYRKGRDRALAAGARHHEREKHGYGGQKYPELRRTAKTTKKVVMKLTCKQCGYILQRKGVRLRKATIKT
ncbi:50S ribosomal protein L44e [Candidatus Bathyarchaeota archaeon]|nr:MAG: 50S ribosomal protein L44e [Candidatus Hecatellales archaeon ex4484_218]RJX15193.1 MAG: 50S ribosomal protein L44e [Candidatus Bathyarchaeota archaeon]